MRIVVLPPRGVIFPQDSPWMALIDGLASAGHEVQGFGATELPADALVTLNDQPAARHLQSTWGISPGRSALVVLEPRVTAPGMYTSRTLCRYGHRFAASPLWAKSIGADSFRWPQDIRPDKIDKTGHSFEATIINGEKRSAVDGSLYGLRRSVIQALDGASIPLAVVGPGWSDAATHRLQEGSKAVARAVRARSKPNVVEAFSQPSIRPRNVMGIFETKRDAFALAPTTIIIENSRDYVSEKLIDAVCAGVAPIYVGPPLEQFDLPSSIAVQASATPNAVLKSLQQMTLNTHEDVIREGQNWLRSEHGHQHQARVVMRKLGAAIGYRFLNT